MTTQTTKSEALDLLKTLHAKVDALSAAVAALKVAPARTGGGGDGAFPNYGRDKGLPIKGASMDSLNYYADGARRSLADPAKERWHAKEQALLAAIEAEISRQSAGDGPPPHSDEDAPF